MIEITEDLQKVYRETAKKLKGSERRQFMAGIVKSLGRGGQRYVEEKLGWNRGTVRKGQKELATGIECVDNFAGRGRKRAEEHLPELLTDIRDIAESYSQTDPTLQSTRQYTRLSAAQMRQRLLDEKGYKVEELPCVETINTKMNQLGYKLGKVQKSKPKKR